MPSLKGLLHRLDFRNKPPSVSTFEHLWSIGIYSGSSPTDLQPAPNVTNPVLTRKEVSDVRAAFVADPFMIKVGDSWHMFFEVWNRQSGKGEIGLATSQDALKWTYQRIVLAEPFHLSYPYVFEWMNDYYLVPESYQAGAIRLYRAAQFPFQWTFLGEILTGPYFADTSIFQHQGLWWLFTETNPTIKSDTLRLYVAERLPGPWKEHPCSPLIQSNGHIARPAGRVVSFRNQVIRYAQDCDPVYGTQVFAFEVVRLTASDYQEHPIGGSPILGANGSAWSTSGMHHIDPHPLDEGGWIACVDGWRAVPSLATEERCWQGQRQPCDKK
jgi:hypothetical protein